MYVYSYFERGCRESARYNPERHCGWFWVHCSSEKFERIGTKVHGNMFASATVGSTATVVRNSVSIISHITFRYYREHIFSNNLPQNSCICMNSTPLAIKCYDVIKQLL